jgi:hypothetical protein
MVCIYLPKYFCHDEDSGTYAKITNRASVPELIAVGWGPWVLYVRPIGEHPLGIYCTCDQ